MQWRGSSRWHLRPAVVASGLVFALAGLMFAAAATTSQGTDLRAERAVQLRDLVRQQSAKLDRLDAKVTAQQGLVDDLSEGRTGDIAALELRRDIDSLRTDAGMTPVTGRALRVTLDDAPLRETDDPLWQTVTPDDVIVHQGDVQAVINALWRGGAEAIQVMDQRLIDSSSLQCVGNTLLLQGRVYSPPYVITAVGPLRQMRASLWQDVTVADYRAWADAIGLGYEIERLPDYTIPAYEGPISTEFATVASQTLTTPSADPTG